MLVVIAIFLDAWGLTTAGDSENSVWKRVWKLVWKAVWKPCVEAWPGVSLHRVRCDESSIIDGDLITCSNM